MCPPSRPARGPCPDEGNRTARRCAPAPIAASTATTCGPISAPPRRVVVPRRTVNGWIVASGSSVDAGLDPGRARVDDRHAREHVLAVDAVAQHGPGRGELDARVDPLRLGGIGRDVRRRPARRRRRAAAPRRSGRARPACSPASGVRAPTTAPRRGRRRSTSSTSRISSSSGVASAASTIARSAPVAVTHDPAVRAHVRRLEGEDGRRGAARVGASSTQPLEQRRREQRRVAGQHEHLVRAAVERRARGADGVAGAERLLLDRDRHAVERRRASRATRRRRAARAELPRGLEHPVDEPASEQRVQVLRRRGAHARAESTGHHDCCECALGHRQRMAGAPGFEPGITGPKPVALPLGYAPVNGSRAIGVVSGGRRRARRAPPPRSPPTATSASVPTTTTSTGTSRTIACQTATTQAVSREPRRRLRAAPSRSRRERGNREDDREPRRDRRRRRRGAPRGPPGRAPASSRRSRSQRPRTSCRRAR